MSMEKQRQIEDALWAYIHGELSCEACREFEGNLVHDTRLQLLVAQARLVHELMPEACRQQERDASVNARIEAIYDADNSRTASEDTLTGARRKPPQVLESPLVTPPSGGLAGSPKVPCGEPPRAASIPFLRVITRRWSIAVAAAAAVLLSTVVLWPPSTVEWTEAEINLLRYRGDQTRTERECHRIKSTARAFSKQLERSVSCGLRERDAYRGKRGCDAITLSLALYEQGDGSFVADITARTPAGSPLNSWSLRSRSIDVMAAEIDGLVDRITEDVAALLAINDG